MTRARQLEEAELAGQDKRHELREGQLQRAARAVEVARVNTLSQFERRLTAQAAKDERRAEYTQALAVQEKKRRKGLVKGLERKDQVYDRWAGRKVD